MRSKTTKTTPNVKDSSYLENYSQNLVNNDKDKKECYHENHEQHKYYQHQIKYQKRVEV